MAGLLWWNAADEAVPEGRVDLAFTMRPGDFRGQRQATLTLLAWRTSDSTALPVRVPSLNVIDLRGSDAVSFPPDALIWAEGPKQSGHVDRLGLRQATNLVIWQAPPGRDVLLQALDVVRPRSVYLVVRRQELAHTPEELIRRLAGMAKYAIRELRGLTSVSRLAAASAQRELTVRIGLEWLAAAGQLVVKPQDDLLELSRGPGEANTALQAELAAGLKSLLEETASYRRRFETAPPHTLLPSSG